VGTSGPTGVTVTGVQQRDTVEPASFRIAQELYYHMCWAIYEALPAAQQREVDELQKRYLEARYGAWKGELSMKFAFTDAMNEFREKHPDAYTLAGGGTLIENGSSTCPDRQGKAAGGSRRPGHAREPRKRSVVFRLSSPGQHVSIAGSFTGWNPKTMTKQGSVWVYRAELAPGSHLYKYIVDGFWILDPANPHRKRDTSGNENSVITIGAPADAG
jgi:hypothetical protein